MNTENKKKLQAEFIWSSIRSGAFQRSRIYDNSATDEDKTKFRTGAKDFLYKNIFLKYYKSEINETRLKKLIENFIIQNAGNKALKGKELRYGNAQKFINLYLKGMWVLGYLKTPPHFPVDRIMIGRLKLKENWTTMDENKYDNVISKSKDKLKETNYKSIAEWEAEEYQKNYLDK